MNVILKLVALNLFIFSYFSEYYTLRKNDNNNHYGLGVQAIPFKDPNIKVTNCQKCNTNEENQELPEDSQVIEDVYHNSKEEEEEDQGKIPKEGEEEGSFNEILENEESESENCSKKIIGYYAEWTASILPPSEIAYDKLTHINYAFGIIDPITYNVIGYDPNILSEVITNAHLHYVKVLLSIGGWTGSEFFTEMTSSEENMNAFIENVHSIILNFNLDGIDIDWEYPGRVGNNNKPDFANDVPNYLILLKKLRETLGEEKLITAAVSPTPFEQNGRVLNDLSEFSNYFDFISVMAYDYSGSWSSLISHHESFDIPEKGHDFSFKKSIQNWIIRGFPPEKIVAGVGAYGRSWIANSKINYGLYQTFDRTVIDRENDDSSIWNNYCQQDEMIYSSSYKFKNIYKYILSLGKYLDKKRQDPLFEESQTIIQYECWLRVWDSVAQAPYLFNTKFNNVISYDDPQSLKIKMNYVQENGLAGVMMWDLDGDSEDWILVNTLNNILCSSD